VVLETEGTALISMVCGISAGDLIFMEPKESTKVEKNKSAIAIDSTK